MLLNVVFDKIAFVKFNISNNLKQEFTKQIQNNQKSIGKSMPTYGFLESQEKNPQTKSLETYSQSLWFQWKKTMLQEILHGLGIGLVHVVVCVALLKHSWIPSLLRARAAMGTWKRSHHSSKMFLARNSSCYCIRNTYRLEAAFWSLKHHDPLKASTARPFAAATSKYLKPYRT
jgi:hypothetical protein